MATAEISVVATEISAAATAEISAVAAAEISAFAAAEMSAGDSGYHLEASVCLSEASGCHLEASAEMGAGLSKRLTY